MTLPQVFQFKITLQGITPSVWRRIQIVENCTFWDLHVAIQNAMGWQDSHLHEFHVIDLKTDEPLLLGIPDEWGEIERLAGWDYPVKTYLNIHTDWLYMYDFGDEWEHRIQFEGLFDKKPKQTYPLCMAGQQACPPEDVGGIHGYQIFLQAIEDPSHEEHESYLAWVGGHYDPHHFVPKHVKFEDPHTRFKEAFE